MKIADQVKDIAKLRSAILTEATETDINIAEQFIKNNSEDNFENDSKDNQSSYVVNNENSMVNAINNSENNISAKLDIPEQLQIILDGILEQDKQVIDLIMIKMFKYIHNRLFPQIYFKMFNNELICTISFERVFVKSIILAHNELATYFIPLRDGEDIINAQHSLRKQLLQAFTEVVPDFRNEFDQEIEDLKIDYLFRMCH